jgi:hypothetical protein
MSDEHPIGAALRRQLELLSGRLEVLEQRHARAEAQAIDWQQIDELRIDQDVAFDALDLDVEAAIERRFSAEAAALRRRIRADFPDGV